MKKEQNLEGKEQKKKEEWKEIKINNRKRLSIKKCQEFIDEVHKLCVKFDIDLQGWNSLRNEDSEIIFVKRKNHIMKTPIIKQYVIENRKDGRKYHCDGKYYVNWIY